MGSPDPEWSFQQFRSLGWNLVRMDGLSWGMYQNDSSRFTSNLNRVINAANANGIYVIWGFANIPSSVPTDVHSNFADFGQYWTWWWNDGMYNGNQQSLQGLPAWQAFFKGFVGPIVTKLDSQPCTLGYKFVNEPGNFPSSNSDSYLSAYYASIGSQVRAMGSTKYFVYEGPGAHPGSVDLINSIQRSMSAGNYRPAIYDVHYPQSSGVSSDGPLTVQNNVSFWDGEDFASYVVASGYMQSFVQNNAASSVYRWDEDGNLLASGAGSTPGTLTSGAYSLSNQQTQVLGTAKFFA
jgi:hypothetical protein